MNDLATLKRHNNTLLREKAYCGGVSWSPTKSHISDLTFVRAATIRVTTASYNKEVTATSRNTTYLSPEGSPGIY